MGAISTWRSRNDGLAPVTLVDGFSAITRPVVSGHELPTVAYEGGLKPTHRFRIDSISAVLGVTASTVIDGPFGGRSIAVFGQEQPTVRTRTPACGLLFASIRCSGPTARFVVAVASWFGLGFTFGLASLLACRLGGRSRHGYDSNSI